MEKAEEVEGYRIIDCHAVYLRRPDFSVDMQERRTEAIVIGMKASVDFHKRESHAAVLDVSAYADTDKRGPREYFSSASIARADRNNFRIFFQADFRARTTAERAS